MRIGSKAATWFGIAAVFAVMACSGGGDKKATTKPKKDSTEAAAVDAAPPKPKVVGPALLFSVEPADAEVIVDRKQHGKISELENNALKVSPGLHQVTIRKVGYKTYRAEVTVRESVETITVKLELAPK